MFKIMVFWSDRYVPVQWRNLSANLYVASHCRRTVTGQAHTLQSVSYLTKPASECPRTQDSSQCHPACGGAILGAWTCWGTR